MKRIYLIILIVCAIATLSAKGQTRVLFFNCENAFDTVHDEGKNDFEYAENGDRRWNSGRLYRKLEGVSKVIAAADSLSPVAIVGLCEVENDSVLEFLTRKSVLRNLGYKYIMTDSEDARGVDVAMLYSEFAFKPFGVERIRPSHVGTPTRDILHVSGIVRGRDTLDVYVVHLPSKLGGKVGKIKSLQVAEGLMANVDSIMNCRGCANIVIMGDFNAEYKSSLFKDVLGTEKYWRSEARRGKGLYDVIMDKEPRGMGTYKYKGVWSVIDHILVSGNVHVKDAGVLVSPLMLEKDTKYGGVKPKRTYIGFKYNGGISDHLPVWMTLGM